MHRKHIAVYYSLLMSWNFQQDKAVTGNLANVTNKNINVESN
jgi:hypothetical protein